MNFLWGGSGDKVGIFFYCMIGNKTGGYARVVVKILSESSFKVVDKLIGNFLSGGDKVIGLVQNAIDIVRVPTTNYGSMDEFGVFITRINLVIMNFLLLEQFFIFRGVISSCFIPISTTCFPLCRFPPSTGAAHARNKKETS